MMISLGSAGHVARITGVPTRVGDFRIEELDRFQTPSAASTAGTAVIRVSILGIYAVVRI